MAEPSPPQQQQGCGVVNLILPLFFFGGVYLGWRVGFGHGVVWGLLGGVAGAVLSFPAMGLTLTAVLGVAWLLDRVTGGGKPEGE